VSISDNEFWQINSDLKFIPNDEMLRQKLDYIHYAPEAHLLCNAYVFKFSFSCKPAKAGALGVGKVHSA